MVYQHIAQYHKERQKVFVVQLILIGIQIKENVELQMIVVIIQKQNMEQDMYLEQSQIHHLIIQKHVVEN